MGGECETKRAAEDVSGPFAPKNEAGVTGTTMSAKAMWADTIARRTRADVAARLRIVMACVLAFGAASEASAQSAAALERAADVAVPLQNTEHRFRYSILENGDFAERSALRPVPGWRASSAKVVMSAPDEVRGLSLPPGEWIEAPLPAFAPMIGSLEIRFSTEGSGVVAEIREGASVVHSVTASASPSPHETVIRAADIRASLGRDPMPRLTLRLVGNANTIVRSVEATVDLPCPTEAELRAEIVAQLKSIFATWFERSLDDVGPRKTGFLAKAFDAVTGETLGVAGVTGFSNFYQALFDALQFEDDPVWRARFDAFLEDFLTLQIQPETGLPRLWDTQQDTPLEATPLEIALPFGFLIDVAERGPERFRARAQAIAVKIGDTVLARGQMADGTCAPSYVPKDGAPNVNVNQLHRLDVPTQLVRLSKLTGDERYRHAAREPLATLEFTHYWAGTWDAIDPGFDDQFGFFGARAATVARAVPEEVLYSRFALEGWKHYAPLWRDALLLGGNVAADQVRCWEIGVDLAHVDPALRAGMGPLLRIAARSHFRGEQYGNGAWGDVTIFGFDPRTLEVGDFTGAPQNLLNGLALVYVGELGLRTDEIRAMYTAVLRSSVAQYGRPYGFLLQREEHKGANSSQGSLRMLTGLVEMLRAVSAER